jgi:small-conductance mechanosensitive channel/CRP-like cAMP-binding protein
VGKFSVIIHVIQSFLIILFWTNLYFVIKVSIFDTYREKYQEDIPGIFKSMTRFLFLFFAILSIMVIVFDQSLMSIATLGGLVGAGLTFALGELILDTFSGIVLEIEGPLNINDWIQLSDGKEGMVVKINWRTVVLKTIDDTLLIVPQRDLTKIFMNYSQPDQSYWDYIEIGLDHTLPVERAERILRAGVMKTPTIHNFECQAHACNLNESGINYRLRYKVPNRGLANDVRHDVIQTVTNHLHDCNLRISEVLGEYAVSLGGQPFKEEEQISVDGLIDKVDLLKTLPEVIKKRISEKSIQHVVSAGEIIVHEGDEGHSLFLIAEGVVTISISYTNEMGEQREKMLFNLGFSECFGEMSLFLKDPRSATVRAATNCLLYEISHDLIEDTLKATPEILTQLIQDAQRKKEKNLKLKEEMSKVKEHETLHEKGIFAHLRDLFK